MKEIWKTIKGYSEYEVSNLGNIRHKKKNRIVKSYIHYGKNVVSLYIRQNKNKVQRQFYVDNIVAFNFLTLPYTISASVIKHKNGNYLDDRADNLVFRKDCKTNVCLINIYLFRNNKCRLVSVRTYSQAKRFLQCTDGVLQHAITYASVIKTIDGKEYKVEYKFNKV